MRYVAKFIGVVKQKQCVEGAQANNKKLFNPKSNFNIPNFKNLPEKVLRKLTDLKEEYVFNIQKEAAEATTFTIQLILLKIVKQIKDFLKTLPDQVNEQTEQNLIEYILATSYFIALIEFPKSKKVHVIDWTTYQSKTTHAIPMWRKVDPENPPVDVQNRLADGICYNINAAKIKLEGKAVESEFYAMMAGNIPYPQNQYRNNYGQGGYRNRGRGGRNFNNRSGGTYYNRGRPMRGKQNGRSFNNSSKENRSQNHEQDRSNHGGQVNDDHDANATNPQNHQHPSRPYLSGRGKRSSGMDSTRRYFNTTSTNTRGQSNTEAHNRDNVINAPQNKEGIINAFT
ncbi:hypothetical protein Fcan01_00144 [Folsomia candida]|uniref:Uncharacterized protein n=1 Tax=Folsomia candida TaxID=158441 RepID=A0A226F5C4_FOLCA|nr:hypothetical protein Fcan01_00144 [Folsomia candida]